MRVYHKAARRVYHGNALRLGSVTSWGRGDLNVEVQGNPIHGSYNVNNIAYAAICSLQLPMSFPGRTAPMLDSLQPV